MKAGITAVLVLCAASLPRGRTAQTYPAKPIRIIVPYPPGGTSDILTRMIGQKLTESWGQSVIADSRPGAAGIIGVEAAVRSPADGYTLVLMDVGNLTIMPSVFRKLPFDMVRDLAPVGMVSYSSHLFLGASRRAGQQREGVDRAREEAAREAQLRHRPRHGAALCRNAVHPARRDQSGPTCPARAVSSRCSRS
jgi:tripartite-type tricarboxylate transporter receptor subunit TctC